MTRSDGRSADQLRPVRFTRGWPRGCGPAAAGRQPGAAGGAQGGAAAVLLCGAGGGPPLPNGAAPRNAGHGPRAVAFRAAAGGHVGIPTSALAEPILFPSLFHPPRLSFSCPEHQVFTAYSALSFVCSHHSATASFHPNRPRCCLAAPCRATLCSTYAHGPSASPQLGSTLHVP